MFHMFLSSALLALMASSIPAQEVRRYSTNLVECQPLSNLHHCHQIDPLSTHVLDTTSGMPGKGVNVSLSLLALSDPPNTESWQLIAEK